MGIQKGNAPRNNQAQNKQFRSIVQELKLNKKQAEILHRETSNMGYGREEIRDIALSLFFEGDEF